MRQRRIAHAAEFVAEDDAAVNESDFRADVPSHQLVVARQNLDFTHRF
jgi:hypothetical protein